MVRKIIRYPNQSLRRPCLWVSDVPSMAKHIQDLKDTLAATPNGVALASNQILETGFKIFVVRPGTKLPDVVINPRWRPDPDRSQLWQPEEGCLSIPELQTRSNRQSHIIFDWHGSPDNIMHLDGLEAQIVQHECEHLEGRSLVDHIEMRQRIALRAEAIKNRKMGR